MGIVSVMWLQLLGLLDRPYNGCTIALERCRSNSWVPSARRAENPGSNPGAGENFSPFHYSYITRPAQGLLSPSRLTARERNADIGCALYKGGLEEVVISYKMYTKALIAAWTISIAGLRHSDVGYLSGELLGGSSAPRGRPLLNERRLCRRAVDDVILAVDQLREVAEEELLPIFEYAEDNFIRKEQRLRVFENKVLRKIFVAERNEITGEWRKLHNAELHPLYSSPDIIRNIKSRRLIWAGHVARMGESRNAYRVLVERPEGKRPLGRPRRRWEDNIKMDLRGVGYDGRDWINLAQDRDQCRAYVRAAINLRIGDLDDNRESDTHMWAILPQLRQPGPILRQVPDKPQEAPSPSYIRTENSHYPKISPHPIFKRDIKKKNRSKKEGTLKISKGNNIAANQFFDNKSDIDVIFDDETDISIVSTISYE
ncbi:hypothetical protein ANN_01276 [Periplaneta americana]|uniref:Uncharacterized protein n=1 Tax=Periplaneta americana TaxID=6978 RepID=A0ABQ8TW52_PERAM|nr:hypothetical protein ANN_01276 [Periplaneta americana]